MYCTWEPIPAGSFDKTKYNDLGDVDQSTMDALASELGETLFLDAEMIQDALDSEDITLLEHGSTGEIAAVVWEPEISYWKRVCRAGAPDGEAMKAGLPWIPIGGALVGGVAGYLLGGTKMMGRNDAIGAAIGAAVGGLSGFWWEKRDSGPTGRVPRRVRFSARGPVGAVPGRVRMQPRGPVGLGYVPPKVLYTSRGPIGSDFGVPMRDGSGRGTRSNYNRGGCMGC